MKITKKQIGIHRKEPGPPSIIIKNKKVHIINPKNIVTINNISRLGKDQPPIHIIHMEANHLSNAETFVTV